MSNALNLEPKARAFVEALAAANLPRFEDLTPEAARELTKALRPQRAPRRIAHVADHAVAGPGGDILVRECRDTDAPAAAILYFHAGGWVLGSVAASDNFLREIAAATACTVYAVDYRKAPEARYPAAADDAWAALQRLAARTTLPVILMGESAGGQLATVTAMRARAGRRDLALAIIGGGLRRYLDAKDELPDQPLIAMCPINVRGEGDPLEGGNQVTSMRVPIGTDIADPVERLRAIVAASTEGKHQAEQFGATFFPDLMALYPYPIRSALLRGATAFAERRGSPVSVANVVVSNMPPPTGDWYFAGSKFLAWAGNGMLTPGLGLFLIVAGIRTDLSISVTSTRDVLPDPAFFVDRLRGSYREYLALADGI